jgi:hypothetical protein
MAQLLALVANVNRDPARRRRPYVPADFLPERGPRREPDQASLRTGIDAAMVAFGGRSGERAKDARTTDGGTP